MNRQTCLICDEAELFLWVDPEARLSDEFWSITITCAACGAVFDCHVPVAREEGFERWKQLVYAQYRAEAPVGLREAIRRAQAQGGCRGILAEGDPRHRQLSAAAAGEGRPTWRKK